jgi:hypothetical protein
VVRRAGSRSFIGYISVLALAAGVTTAVAWPASGDPAPEPGTSLSDTELARIAAEQQGARVEVTSLEDAYSTTYVNPDGTQTTETSVSQLRVMQGGGWVDVDYDLQHVDGGWSPKAAPVPVVFSDGADTDAATVGSGVKQVDLSWDLTLPTPTIDGRTASYDLGNGQSLLLVVTERGFEQSLVLSKPPTSLPRIRLPFDTVDLTLVADGSGGYTFDNAAGATMYRMPAPIMYGSKFEPETGIVQQRTVATSLVDTTEGARLDLTPSMAWLTDPSTVYPVTIDPVVSAVGGASDTWVQTNVATAQGTSNVLHVGEYGGANPSRTFLRFTGMSNYAGATITQAQLNLRNYSVNTCTAATITALPLTKPVDFSGVTWASRPIVNDGYSNSTSTDGSGSFAHGIDPGCPNGWGTVNIIDMVKMWAANPSTNYGVQLSGTETTGSQYWGFCSLNYDPSASGSCTTSSYAPTLAITFSDTGPDTPILFSYHYPENEWATGSSQPLDLQFEQSEIGIVPASYGYAVDGGAAGSVSAGSGQPTTVGAPTALGEHTIDYWAVDALGQSSPHVAYTFFIGNPPSPPSQLTVTTGAHSAKVQWTAGAENGAPTAEFHIQLVDLGNSSALIDVGTCSECDQFVITSLTEGRQYQFKVSADSDAGEGTAATSASFTIPNGGPAPTCTDGCYVEDIVDAGDGINSPDNFWATHSSLYGSDIEASLTGMSSSYTVINTSGGESTSSQCDVSTSQRVGAWLCPTGTASATAATTETYPVEWCHTTPCWSKLDAFRAITWFEHIFGYGTETLGWIDYEANWTLQSNKTLLKHESVRFTHYPEARFTVKRVYMLATLEDGGPTTTGGGHQLQSADWISPKSASGDSYYAWPKTDLPVFHNGDTYYQNSIGAFAFYLQETGTTEWWAYQRTPVNELHKYYGTYYPILRYKWRSGKDASLPRDNFKMGLLG